MAYFLRDYVFAAKYPFSSLAKEMMRERSLDPTDQVAELGFERLRQALGGEIRTRKFLHENDAMEEIISYAAARMILAHMRNRFLSNRYAVAEAKKTSYYLAHPLLEEDKGMWEDNESAILSVAADLGIKSFGDSGGSLSVDVTDFLLYAPKDVHYKLISRELSHGRVRITKSERIRLIEEAVKKYAEKIPAAQAVPPSIKKASEKLHALLPKIEPQKITFKEGENPPCMEALIDLMRKHENVGHTGRWLLAVYLISRGMPTKAMLDIFSNAPDYNEQVSTYQIEHARKKGYKMPNCSSVLGYGYCIADCRITNPLQWRKGMAKGPKENKVG